MKKKTYSKVLYWGSTKIWSPVKDTVSQDKLMCLIVLAGNVEKGYAPTSI
jgi:hypothetical protein